MANITLINNIIWSAVLLLLAVLIGIIIIYFVWWRKFTHTFVSRKVASDKTVISIRKCRIMLDTEGREVLRFRNKLYGYKEYIVPPQEAQDIDFKGKIWTEAYYVDGEGFTYIDFPNKKTEKINPLSVDDRDYLINEFTKAKKRAGEGWKQHVPMIVAFGFMLIVFVLLLVNWKAISEPVLGMADRMQTMQETEVKVLELIQDIRSEEQTIKVGFDQPLKNNTG